MVTVGPASSSPEGSTSRTSTIEGAPQRARDRRHDEPAGNLRRALAEVGGLALSEPVGGLVEHDERQDVGLVERRLARQRQLRRAHRASDGDVRHDARDLALGGHVERRIDRGFAAERDGAVAQHLETPSLEVVGAAHGGDRAEEHGSAGALTHQREVAAGGQVDVAEPHARWRWFEGPGRAGSGCRAPGSTGSGRGAASALRRACWPAGPGRASGSYGVRRKPFEHPIDLDPPRVQPHETGHLHGADGADEVEAGVHRHVPVLVVEHREVVAGDGELDVAHRAVLELYPSRALERVAVAVVDQHARDLHGLTLQRRVHRGVGVVRAGGGQRERALLHLDRAARLTGSRRCR